MEEEADVERRFYALEHLRHHHEREVVDPHVHGLLFIHFERQSGLLVPGQPTGTAIPLARHAVRSHASRSRWHAVQAAARTEPSRRIGSSTEATSNATLMTLITIARRG